MRDEMGIDNKVLCVAATDPRMADLRDIEDLSEFDRLEIDQLLRGLQGDLEPGEEVETATWVGQRPPTARSRRARERASFAG